MTRNPPQLRLFRPPVSLCFQGFSRVLKTKYFAVLTRRSNILVFPLFWGSRCSDRVWHTRSGIEVVITRTTRNRLIRKGPWVRIPPTPPKKSSKLKGLLDFPFLSASLNFPIFALNGVRIGRFCVRTACFFSQKTGFKSGSVILPCSVTFSQRLPKSSDLGRSIPCSMACAEDILDL